MPYRSLAHRICHPYFGGIEPEHRSRSEMGLWPLLLRWVDDGAPDREKQSPVRRGKRRRKSGDKTRDSPAPSACKIMKNSIDPVHTIVESTDDKFTINIPVGADFEAENLDAKVKNRVVMVNIKFEQISEDGTSHLIQMFTKNITLPEQAKVEKITSRLTPEGVLKIEAPLPASRKHPPKTQEVEIPVTWEG